jgi:16S rRNA (guanine966-N2)-methyltransferase
MRIIGGRFKGRRVPAFPGKKVRPTSDRVREALFNILGDEIRGAGVLDLFAGTGAFGFEALSRGAARVVFVEHDPRIARMISQTAELFDVAAQCEIVTAHAERALKLPRLQHGSFAIVFLDPPYASNHAERIVFDPVFPSIAVARTLVVVERSVRSGEMKVPEFMVCETRRTYGETAVDFYRVEPDAKS